MNIKFYVKVEVEDLSKATTIKGKTVTTLAFATEQLIGLLMDYVAELRTRPIESIPYPRAAKLLAQISSACAALHELAEVPDGVFDFALPNFIEAYDIEADSVMALVWEAINDSYAEDQEVVVGEYKTDKYKAQIIAIKED